MKDKKPKSTQSNFNNKDAIISQSDLVEPMPVKSDKILNDVSLSNDALVAQNSLEKLEKDAKNKVCSPFAKT